MFRKILHRSKGQPSAMPNLEHMKKTLHMLEAKEKLLGERVNTEVKKAKEFMTAKNRRGATLCLKKKRFYEQQVEQLVNSQLRIHEQMIMLDTAKVTTDTVDSLRKGAATMKAIQKATKISDVDDTISEIDHQMDTMKQIQEALSSPVGSSAEFDEDELLSELDDLEMNDELLQTGFAQTTDPLVEQKEEEVPQTRRQAEMAQFSASNTSDFVNRPVRSNGGASAL